jgi:hypothetical protein
VAALAGRQIHLRDGRIERDETAQLVEKAPVETAAEATV